MPNVTLVNCKRGTSKSQTTHAMSANFDVCTHAIFIGAFAALSLS